MHSRLGINMNLSSIVFDNSLISEAFYHVLEYSNSEIIITDKNLNIIFQNSKFNFKNQNPAYLLFTKHVGFIIFYLIN